jgi:hypothetical protein
MLAEIAKEKQKRAEMRAKMEDPEIEKALAEKEDPQIAKLQEEINKLKGLLDELGSTPSSSKEMMSERSSSYEDSLNEQESLNEEDSEKVSSKGKGKRKQDFSDGEVESKRQKVDDNLSENSDPEKTKNNAWWTAFSRWGPNSGGPSGNSGGPSGPSGGPSGPSVGPSGNTSKKEMLDSLNEKNFNKNNEQKEENVNSKFVMFIYFVGSFFETASEVLANMSNIFT